MINWTSFIDDTNNFFSSYDIPPSLESTYINGVLWEFGDPNSIFVNLCDLSLPQRIPVLWHVHKYNLCKITLQFIDIKNITNNLVIHKQEVKSLPLTIFTQDKNLMASVQIVSNWIPIFFSFSRVKIVGIWGYQDFL
jgi:hypothetical protein